MEKLENGKVYVGHVVGNVSYIGKYNEETNSLDELWGVGIKETNIQIIPCVHPIFLQKKFVDELESVSFGLEHFLFVSDLDKLELGSELKKVYNEANKNVVFDTDDTELKKETEKEVKKDNILIMP